MEPNPRVLGPRGGGSALQQSRVQRLQSEDSLIPCLADLPKVLPPGGNVLHPERRPLRLNVRITAP